MDIYKWTDDLLTNNLQIDKDHKEIIRIAQDLHNEMAKGGNHDTVRKTIIYLNDYVKRHFKDEEVLQLKSGYPDASAHKNAHREFIKELTALSDDMQTKPISSLHSIRLNKLMSGWFFNHIKNLDVKVAHHIKTH